MSYNLEDVLDGEYDGEFDEAATVGIDIGSRGAKGVLLYKGKIYVCNESSGISTKQTAKHLLEVLLTEAKVEKKEVLGIVGTGYGSVAMDFGDIPFWPITEITCHAMGAHYLHNATETVIDIGGQDSKAIRVDPDTGRVNDFIMNDKCAAGTGRFLEKVAQILEIPLDELGDTVLKSNNPADISSQCVVFAESEVISLRANGAKKEDIVYGIHLASARRIQTLLKKTGFKKDILFTGGVSNNVGMRRAIEEIIGEKLSTTKLDSVYAGALGAAVYAHKYSKGEKKWQNVG